MMPMQNNSTTKKVCHTTLNNLETQLFEMFERQNQTSKPKKSSISAILAYAAAFDVVQTNILGKVSLINN